MSMSGQLWASTALREASSWRRERSAEPVENCIIALVVSDTKLLDRRSDDFAHLAGILPVCGADLHRFLLSHRRRMGGPSPEIESKY
jgi:hypothetical protein